MSDPKCPHLNFLWSYQNLKQCESDRTKCDPNVYDITTTCLRQYYLMETVVDIPVEENKCQKGEVAVICGGEIAPYCSKTEYKYKTDVQMIDGKVEPYEYSYQCEKAESYFSSKKDWIPLCNPSC